MTLTHGCMNMLIESRKGAKFKQTLTNDTIWMSLGCLICIIHFIYSCFESILFF